MSYLDYRDLLVWKKSMRLVKVIYQLVHFLPYEERFALSDQMRRAAVSIPSNIAEGEARKSKKEFLHYLSVANGSRAELETQLLICYEMQFLTKKQIEQPLSLCKEISKMIFSLEKRIRETEH